MLNNLQLIFNKVVASEKRPLPTSGVITFVNPYSALRLAKDKSVDLSKITTVYSDGFYLSAIIRFYAKLNITRRSFDLTSMALDVFKGESVGVVGATEDELTTFSTKLFDLYGVTVQPLSHGYVDFTDEAIAEIIQDLTEHEISTLVLGLGCPKQEKVALDFQQQNPKLLIFTCGAFIAQSAQSVGLNYYPTWVNSLNLRWLYRLYKEPHTLKRLPCVIEISFYALLIKAFYGKG